MTVNIEYNKTPGQEMLVLRSKEMDLEAGWLGKCFGGRSNAPLNIAGLLVVLLVGSGVSVLFFESAISPPEYWKIIIPLLTLVMGYMFGKSSKD
jgi:hypothetical protein